MLKTKYVIASVIEKDGKFLIAQRAKKDALFGKWELPGGKLEENETFQECLKRELFEELNILAEVGEFIAESAFELNGTDMRLLAFHVPSFTGEIQLKEHSDVKWVAPAEFSLYEFPAPDLPILQVIQEWELAC